MYLKEKHKFFNYFHCAQVFFRNGRHHPIFSNVEGSQDNKHPLTIRKDWKTMRHGVKLSKTPVCSLEKGCLFHLSHPWLCEWASLLCLEDTARLICLTNEERCEALRVTETSDVVAVLINHSHCSWDNARLTCGGLCFHWQSWGIQVNRLWEHLLVQKWWESCKGNTGTLQFIDATASFQGLPSGHQREIRTGLSYSLACEIQLSGSSWLWPTHLPLTHHPRVLLAQHIG